CCEKIKIKATKKIDIGYVLEKIFRSTKDATNNVKNDNKKDKPNLFTFRYSDNFMSVLLLNYNFFVTIKPAKQTNIYL
ncbi:MAG: hypothetical protein M1365_03115, partial [Actinobacteria bacterium]|nr:hypothetical protein [Actinomycetota bacterium]